MNEPGCVGLYDDTKIRAVFVLITVPVAHDVANSYIEIEIRFLSDLRASSFTFTIHCFLKSQRSTTTTIGIYRLS